jgi:plastocyanin
MHYRNVKAVLLLAGMVPFLAGCGINPSGAPPTDSSPHNASDSNTSTPSEATRVVIDNFAYSPREITIAPGTRVTWVNRDDVPHTVTSTAKPKVFDSGALDDEKPYTFVFQKPGTYDYFCAVHPHMTGKVIVK